MHDVLRKQSGAFADGRKYLWLKLSLTAAILQHSMIG